MKRIILGVVLLTIAGVLIFFGRMYLRAREFSRMEAAIPRVPAGAYSAGDQMAFIKTPDGRDRQFLLHVPPGTANNRPLPLIVILHGAGDTGYGQSRLSRFNTLADREGFIAVYPYGWKKEWADGRGTSAPDKEGVDDIIFIQMLIAHLEQTLNIDHARVYATGFSNGAVFTNRLGCELSDVFAGIAPVSGMLPTPIAAKCKPSHPPAVLEFHGTADPFTPYAGGLSRGGKGGEVLGAQENISWWARESECTTEVRKDLPVVDSTDSTRVSLITHAGCRGGREAILYMITGGGHTWPGGAQYLPVRVIGSASRQIKASEIIWEFFKAHTKSVSEN